MITGRDVVLGVLPLFHVYGLNAVLGQVLRQQARLVLVDGFDPEGSLDLIEDEAISVLPVAPPVFAYWMQLPGLEDRFGPVRLVLSGSAPLAPELTDAFTERTGVEIHQGYGLTEAAPVVTSTLCSENPTSRSVGAALPGHRDPAGRRARPGAARRGRRRDPDPRRQPVLRLLARRRRRPRRRRLVADRRRRLPRPDRRPLPGRPGQGAGHRLRLQRLPQRGRGRHRRAPGRRRGGGDRGRGREQTGEAVVAYVKPTAAGRQRQPASTSCAGTARTGWPGSSSPR